MRFFRLATVTVLVLVTMTMASRVHGATIYVATWGNDVTGDGSSARPYLTIGKGISVAVNGDVVKVRAGLYTGDGNRNLSFNGKAITVMKDDCLGCNERPVIDCGGSPNRAFTFDHNETSSSVLSYFTIRNGDVRNRVVDFVQDKNGGAIKLQSSPWIVNCIFENCRALGAGAIHIWRSDTVTITATIDGCIFRYDSTTVANQSTHGGAIICARNSAVTIRNCTFEYNVATIDGGAIWASWPGILIENCTFCANKARFNGQGYGGAILASDSATIRNCTFVENIAARGSALYARESQSGVEFQRNTGGPGLLGSLAA